MPLPDTKTIFLPAILGLALFASKLYASDNPFTPPNFPAPKFPGRTYNVRDFGASGGGAANDTAAINGAIQKCNADGGGTVYFPKGQYAAGSIHLLSNVRLMLDAQAVIFGLRGAFELPEPNPWRKYQDGGHSHFHDSLLYGENIENVAIVGGQINGGHDAIGHGDPKPGNGDKLITVKVGKNLDFENITHEKGGHFCYLLDDCQNVTIHGVVIKESRDAVDLMGCSDVRIFGCNFTGCSDDTIGVKSDFALGRRINSENIYVWDSYFESGCNGLQFGSETAGDFHNCNFWNVRIGRAMKAGISITSCDSAVIDDVNYSNIVVTGAACPIYFLIMDRLRTGDPGARVGTIKNVHVQDVTITDCAAGRQGPVQTATISGWKGSDLENITFDNVKIDYPGGFADATAADIVPPYPRDYSPRSFGLRPAAGLYVRHIKNLTLKNFQITFDRPDARPSLVMYDADGVTLDHFDAQKSSGGEIMRNQEVNNLTIEDSAGLSNLKE
ncbi:MAG TPA: glycosyl hydrolase family 28 protein [Alphaproteobacteria bacterium]|nr:glycosyl hydrolase family 28 protein [Alphaproteobacteria bacterium]